MNNTQKGNNGLQKKKNMMGLNANFELNVNVQSILYYYLGFSRQKNVWK